jgi:Fe-S cluster assembly iron-binding protein IscA
MASFDFIRQDGVRVIATKPVSAVVSKQLFEDGLAENVETTIQTLGFFHFEVGDKRYQVNLPVEVTLNAFNVETRDGDTVINYAEGDVIIESTTYFKRIEAVNKFLNFLIGSKIDVDNPEDLVVLFQKNAQMNDTRLSSQPVVVEALVSELIRWNKDETTPLRVALAKSGVQKGDFKLISIKEISRVSSVFNAISFEDINRSLQSAVLMTRRDKPQSQSPVEKVLNY